MAQQKHLAWTELRVGIFVLSGVTLLAVVIFYVTGGGTLAPKYLLYTYLPDVDGLTLGAPVRLDGVDVGNVERIEVAVPSNPAEISKNRSVRVDMRIQKKFQDDIRSDSTAGLVTEGLLGNRYVDIDRGITGSVLPNDSELAGRHEKSLNEAGADLMVSLNQIAQKADTILNDVQSGRGTWASWWWTTRHIRN